MKITSKDLKLTVFNPENITADFVPWILGQKGGQSFLKLTKGDDISFLAVGHTDAPQPELQKSITKLAQDGWKIEGKVDILFDGIMHPDVNILVQKDSLTLELGKNLLALVDPGNNAPILSPLNLVRYEFAENFGFVIPGINIKDNLKLSPDGYVLKIREKPVAKGEIFLDRVMVLAPQEKLGKLKGWATVDPTFKVHAKWIEEKDKKHAETEKCLIISPLNVIVTHIKESIKLNLKDILGLQELRFLLEHLYQTHPVVVNDFLQDSAKLRKLRTVIQNLLIENVFIKDFITILEVIGDNLEQINNTDLMTEIVRLQLAPQICLQYIDKDDKLNVFCFEKALEERLIRELGENVKQPKHFILSAEQAGELIAAIKDALTFAPEVRIIITPPELRLFFNKLLGPQFPQIAFISFAEAASAKANLRIVKEIKQKNESPDKVETKKGKGKKGFWGKKSK